MNGLLEFHGAREAGGRMTSAKAMEWVKNCPNRRVRYFKPGAEPILVPGALGVRVYVLGPPQATHKCSAKRIPECPFVGEAYELAELEGSDLGFLAAIDALGGDVAGGGQPFENWFRITEADAWADDFFGEHYGFTGEDDDMEWRRIESDWLNVSSRLALQLDSYTNNTSLVLAFELAPSGRVLLFPADAQVGNWRSWSKLEWRITDGPEARNVNASGPGWLARCSTRSVTTEVTMERRGIWAWS